MLAALLSKWLASLRGVFWLTSFKVLVGVVGVSVSAQVVSLRRVVWLTVVSGVACHARSVRVGAASLVYDGWFGMTAFRGLACHARSVRVGAGH